MSIGALSGISSYDFYNSGYIQNMYQLMRYRYNMNSALALRGSDKVTSYLGAQGITASTSGVDKTQAFLSAYQIDMKSTAEAADKLSYYKAGNVFSEYTLGSSDEAVAEIATNSLRKTTSFSVNVENLATDTEPARYSITENGRTTRYTSESNTINLNNADATLTLKGTGTTEIYTGVDEDKIVSAMKDMVKQYNNTMETLSLGKNLGSGVYNQYSEMTKPISNGSVLSMVGLSYDKGGNLKLDEDRLRTSLENKYETTRELIGGQYGIATSLGERAGKVLSQSVSSIIGNTAGSFFGDVTDSLFGGSSGSLFGTDNSYNNLFGSSNLGQNYFNMMYDFSRNVPYSYGNFYSVGSVFDLLG